MDYSFPDSNDVSDAAKNLISRLLMVDPAKRPDFVEMLDSEFFRNYERLPK